MGNWIILTKKPPTEVSPPKLSIHWAEPNPLPERNKVVDPYDGQVYHRDGSDWPFTTFGREHDREGAMRIHWANHDIIVFPDEFNILTEDRLTLYVYGESGDDMSHVLVLDDPAALLAAELIETIEEMKLATDAAILDGFHPLAAHVVAIGIHPGIGWFRCVPEYAQLACSEWEMTETKKEQV